MTDLDVETRGRLEAASRRREQVLVGALNAVAVSRTNAARASVALRAAAAAALSTSLSAETRTGPGNDGWDRRPDDTDLVAGSPDGQYLGLSPRRPGRSPAEQHDGQDELEGRDWLR